MISVTFWGVEFFRDFAGNEIQLGHELRYPIQR